MAGNPNWKPGVSGNPNGRPRKQRALSELLRTVGNLRGDDGVPKKRALAEMVWSLALKGDLVAARMIYEYCDGKPMQRVELGGPDNGPIALTFDHAGAVADLALPEDGSTEDFEA